MPEHDIFDLDAAFRDLERDVAGISRPRGAAAAISLARRRRTNRVTGVAAAVALVVASAVLGQGLGEHEPAPTSPHLAPPPKPAPWNAARLSAATVGWAGAWHHQDAKSQHKSQLRAGAPCMFGGYPQGSSHTFTWATRDGGIAVSAIADAAGNPPDGLYNWRHWRRQMDACTTATLVDTSTFAGGGARVYRIAPSATQTAPSYLWIVHSQRSTALLTVFDQAHPLPTAVGAHVMQAFVAGSLDPASYTVPDASQPRVSESQFARQASAWPNGWQQQVSGTTIADHPACSQGWEEGARTSADLRLGGNGLQDYAGFDTVAEAQTAFDSAVTSLEQCQSASYSVTDTRQIGGAASRVAIGSGSIIWVARNGLSVGTIIIPSTGTAPSKAESGSIIVLMDAVLDTYAQAR